MYWFAQDGDCAEMEHVNIKMIKDGIELHQRAEGLVKAHHCETNKLQRIH